MNITIISVGKLKEKYLKQGIDEYAKRLGSYCKLQLIEVPDEKAPENLSEKEMEQVKDKEGEKILSKVKDADTVIAMAIEGDLISSIGIIISSTIIYFTNYQIVDVIMSIIISIILFKGGYKITKSSFVILMEATTLDTEEVYNKIKKIEGIVDIHEFHIWHTDTNEINAAMHILLNEYNTAKDYTIVENIKILLKEEYNIEHCFIALENIKYNNHSL